MKSSKPSHSLRFGLMFLAFPVIVFGASVPSGIGQRVFDPTKYKLQNTQLYVAHTTVTARLEEEAKKAEVIAASEAEQQRRIGARKVWDKHKEVQFAKGTAEEITAKRSLVNDAVSVGIAKDYFAWSSQNLAALGGLAASLNQVSLSKQGQSLSWAEHEVLTGQFQMIRSQALLIQIKEANEARESLIAIEKEKAKRAAALDQRERAETETIKMRRYLNP